MATADRLFDIALRNAGNPAHVHLKLGWDLGQMGRFDRSRIESMKAHEMLPDHPYPLYNVALAYLTEGRFAEADSAYTRNNFV